MTLPFCLTGYLTDGHSQFDAGGHLQEDGMNFVPDSDNTAIASRYRLLGVAFQVNARNLCKDIEVDLDDRPKKLTAIPMYYLASHSAELFLKAALLRRGMAEDELRKFDYRHNLASLLDILTQIGVPVSEFTGTCIQGLSEQHKNHQLCYSVLNDDGVATYWPPVAIVFQALEELLLITRTDGSLESESIRLGSP